VNSLPKTVTRQRHDCDLNLGHSASESSTLTTRLPSHHRRVINLFRRFLDPTRVYTPIGISIGSSVSAGLTGVTNAHTQTDRQTGRQTDGQTDGQTDRPQYIYKKSKQDICTATCTDESYLPHGYLPSRRAQRPIYRYQFILLGIRATCV